MYNVDMQYTFHNPVSFLMHYVIFSNEEDVTAVTDSNGNTLRIRRDTNRMPVRVVAPDNQVRCPDTAFLNPLSASR